MITADRMPVALWPGRLRAMLVLAGALIGLSCFAITAIAIATHSTVMIIQTGSMQPTLPIGSTLLARPVPAASVQDGDIVGIRKADGRILVHRVQSVTPVEPGSPVRSFVLRGDANSVADQPVLADQAFEPTIVMAWSWPGRVVGVLQSRWSQFWLGVVSGMLAMAELVRVGRGGGRHSASSRPGTTGPSRREVRERALVSRPG